jgi:hypothetical protein
MGWEKKFAFWLVDFGIVGEVVDDLPLTVTVSYCSQMVILLETLFGVFCTLVVQQ